MSSLPYSSFQTINKLPLLEFSLHPVLYIIPKIDRYQTVDPYIADDGKFVRSVGQVEKNSISEFGFVHMEVGENLGCSIKNIAPALFFKMYTDLPRSLQLRFPDCSLQFFYLVLGKEILTQNSLREPLPLPL